MVSLVKSKISQIPSPKGNLEAIVHVGSNVYVLKTEDGCIHLILNQAERPTSELILKNASLSVGVDYISLTKNYQNCLTLEFDRVVDEDAVAKIAEHLCEGDNTPRTGDDLLRTIDIFRSVVEEEKSVWTYEKMLGLWGELKVLERLIMLSENNYQILACIRAWKSTSIHCKDFIFSSVEAAFDVKTTTRTQRLHQISSVDQVAGKKGWETKLVSLCARPVAQEEGRSVMNLIARICNLLEAHPHELELFEEKINHLDIDDKICGENYLMERHGKTIMIFEAEDVPGVKRFVRPNLPTGVPELSWPVILSEEGMSGLSLNSKLKDYIRNSKEDSGDD